MTPDRESFAMYQVSQLLFTEPTQNYSSYFHYAYILIISISCLCRALIKIKLTKYSKIGFFINKIALAS